MIGWRQASLPAGFEIDLAFDGFPNPTGRDACRNSITFTFSMALANDVRTLRRS